MKKLGLLLLCFSVFSGCQTKEEYGCSVDSACSVAEETVVTGLQEMSIDESISFFEEKKSGILYFGFSVCPWCQDVVPILKEVSEEEGVLVHYVPTRYGKEKEYKHTYSQEQKEKLTKYLFKYMSENEDGELTLYVPLVVCVEDGVVIDGHVGTVEEHDAHERKITEEEIEVVRNEYKKMFKKLKKDVA